MAEKQENERYGRSERSTKGPPSGTERSAPSIPAPSGARSLASSPERPDARAAPGRRLVHRINIDLSGPALAIFNLPRRRRH
jgi:hypothetical protein